MTEVIKLFEPISLEQMSGVKLMNRTDTKFVTTTERLQQLLQMAQNDYYVQYFEKPCGWMCRRCSISRIGEGCNPSRFSSIITRLPMSLSMPLTRLWKHRLLSIVRRSVFALFTSVIRLK